MFKIFAKVLLTPTITISSLLATVNPVVAQTELNTTLEQINQYKNSQNGAMSQVTNVNQLRDVSPADWAYEALRSLVDRYGCHLIAFLTSNEFHSVFDRWGIPWEV